MELLYRANENLVYLTCGNDNLSLARVDESSSRGSTFDHYGFIVEDKKRSTHGMRISRAAATCR